MPLFYSIFRNFASKYTLFIIMAQKNRNTFHNNKKATISTKPSFSTPKQQSAEKKSFSISPKVQMVFAVIALLVFIATAAYLLITKNAEVLFMAQDRNLYVGTNAFLSEMLDKPGGLLAYAGAYLTQLFYNPTIGASLLIAIWCIIYGCTIKAFRLGCKWAFLAVIPIACLLTSVVDLGYWIYYLKQPGYYFRESLGFLCVMICVYGISLLNKKTTIQSISIVALTAVAYYAIGWYSLLMPAYIVMQKVFSEGPDKKSKIITAAISIISIGLIPLIAYNYSYTEIRLEDAWNSGFPLFKADATEDYYREYPFMVLAVAPLFFPIITWATKKLELKGGVAFAYLIVYALVALYGVPYVCNALNFEDYNYRAEMRMYRATDENDWDKVLEEASSYETTPTREMVILNHIALMNKGTLGSQLFRYNNFGEAPKVDTVGITERRVLNSLGKLETALDEKGNAIIDTLMLRVHMVQTAGPIIYYNHAKTNFASRWCIENAVEYGYSISIMKILAKCAIVNGEWDVARKYLKNLQKTMYYKDWADNYMKLVDNPKLIEEYHEFDYVRELYNHMGTVLDGDNGLCEMYLLNYFANTMNKDSKQLQELTLAYSMIQKDIQLFWPRFFLYAQLHRGEKMPVHYQEAAYLYGNLEHQVDISGMPFDKEVPESYASFQQISQSYLQQGMSVEQVRDAMKANFGHTFYWFYFFCRNVKSY